MNGNPEDVPSIPSTEPAQTPDTPPAGMGDSDAPVTEETMRAYAAHIEARFDALQAQITALAGDEEETEEETEETQEELTNGDSTSGETQPGDATPSEEDGASSGDDTSDTAPRAIHPYFRKVGNGRD